MIGRFSSIRRSAIGAIVGGIAIVGLAAGPAAAASTYLGASTVSTTGASLRCNVYRDASGRGHANCSLTDTAADSKSVYAILQTDRWPEKRINNTGGSGSTLNFSTTIVSDVIHPTFRFKACRNVQFGSDNCSGYANYTL